MKKLILLFFIPLALTGQNQKHEIHWNTNILFESNSLDRIFLDYTLYGGQISDSIKSNWIKSGNNNNIIYSEISNSLSYRYHFTGHNVGFSVADINILNASSTDDFLRIVLEGNFYHQDRTLDFSGTSIRADRFQQFKIKYTREINNMKITGGISYLAGNHHISYLLEKGSLYTAPFGTYLDVEYSMDAFITDTSNFSLLANNGNGIAMDVGADFTIREYDIHVSLSDLGFIMWNNSSITLATDSAFNFQGIEVDDIFTFNDSVLEANNIQDNITKTNNNSFKSYIPATVHFSLSGKNEDKYLKNYIFGIIAKWQPYMDNKPLSLEKINQGFKESNYSPLYYVNTKFYHKSYTISPTFSYGGYSENENIGLALSKGLKNKFTIGTYHLEDLFNSEGNSLGGYFNIYLQF